MWNKTHSAGGAGVMQAAEFAVNPCNAGADVRDVDDDFQRHVEFCYDDPAPWRRRTRSGRTTVHTTRTDHRSRWTASCCTRVTTRLAEDQGRTLVEVRAAEGVEKEVGGAALPRDQGAEPNVHRNRGGKAL